MKNNLIKALSGIGLAITVLATSQPFMASALIPQADAAGARLNADPRDFPVIEVSNYTRCTNSNACWSASITDVRAGDTIAFVMYAHNTGDDDAANTRLNLQLTQNGSQMNGYGRISADNATAVAGNARVSFAESVTSPVTLSFVGGEYYRQSSLDPTGPDSLPSGQTVRQLGEGGVNVGTLPHDAPGVYSNDMQIVVRYRVDAPQACTGTATLRVTPDNQTVNVGETAQFRAIYDENGANCSGGESDVTSAAQWSANNPVTATSLGQGRFRGNRSGLSSVNATYRNLTDTANLTVRDDNQGGNATLVIVPPSQTVNVGNTATYRAKYDPDGPGGSQGEIDVTSNSSWSADNTAVATSLNNGNFRGIREGSTTVRASYQGLQATANLTVRDDNQGGNATLVIVPPSQTVNVGNTATYRAKYDPDGPGGSQGEIDVTSNSSWSADNTAVATSLNNGNFRGIREGSTTVRASYQGLQATANLTVLAGNVCNQGATLRVTPTRDTIDVGDEAQYRATYDSNGNCSGGESDVTNDADWSIDSSSIATNLGDGEFRGRREGSATVRATYRGLSDTASLRVRDDNGGGSCDNERATLVIVPFSSTVSVGQTYQYRALYDEDGPGCSDNGDRDVTNSATWTSNNSGVASNLGNGLFRGNAQGTAPITARFSGISADAQLSVVGNGGGGVIVQPPVVTGGGTIVLPPTVVGGGTIVQQPISTGFVDTSSVACITVTPSVDVTTMLPNQEFVYTTLYRNDCPFALNNAVLRVFMPVEIDILASSNPFFIREGQKMSYNLGTLVPGAQGSVAITGFVHKDAKLGDTLLYTSTIEFLDSTNRIQNAASYLAAILGGKITRPLSANITETLGAIFSSGLFWIFFGLLLLLGIGWFLWSLAGRRNASTTNVVVAKDEDPLRALRNA